MTNDITFILYKYHCHLQSLIIKFCCVKCIVVYHRSQPTIALVHVVGGISMCFS